MLTRKPIVAGSFYPADPRVLKEEVQNWLTQGGQRRIGRASCTGPVWAVVLPHAGHIYSGRVIGDTLADINLPANLFILCPNHTGHGRPLGVWPGGVWQTPLGDVPVNTTLAQELLNLGGYFEQDVASHLGEHSIEVILPFLQITVPGLTIVPITVGTANPALLQSAGHALAKVLKGHPDAGVVISSDMNHYEDQVTTLAKDELALAKACLGDADGLLEVVNRERITMCGAAALALALYAAHDLGYKSIAVTSHETSGKTSGDYDRTVGYAGLHLCRPA